jgi:isoleucyl-tRNA synthetase
MDYKKTLNITLSDKDPGAMPQRGNLPQREPEIQKRWDEIDLYRLSVEKPGPKGTFVLHDGPPYSNGDIHLGHALNKIAKDVIVKYKTMAGYRSPYVPGWDNHGMPIENEVSKEYRKKGEKPDKVTMRRRCRDYAAGFVEKQKTQFKRLGVRGDWDNPYLTMSADFEAKIVEVFGELAEQGYIYRGLKPVLWCAFCETALADAEVEYGDHTSNSIYVRFPVHRDPYNVFGGDTDDPKDAYLVIWTTTPWTIPANLALAVHPDAEYVVMNVDGVKYLVAAPLARKTLNAIGYTPTDAVQDAAVQETLFLTRVKGSDLDGIVTKHPLFHRTSPVVFADYVTMEDGTGVVHTAPGHGKEDFETGQKYGLEILCPVDASGTFTVQAGEGFAGARILGGEADQRVIEALENSGHLLSQAKFQHSYPHCWRCHNPLLFRATVQWFMNIDHSGHRERALNAIEETAWYPPVSKNRISSMVANRPDWCLSRQRAWGVGIPAFYCKSCGKEILSREAINAVSALVARESSDVWYARPAAEILPPGFSCPDCNGTTFDKETDILDVWFDSGSTNRAVLENRQKWPADIYLEGSDQHRGWFNSSLMIGVATKGRAPYDAVITNGWTLDETGKAMHKTAGNAVSPNEVTEKYGADILRLWVASVDYFEDVRCSDSILSQVAETYRRIRNTFRFLVNNLYDFDPAVDAVPYDQMQDLDRWALAQLDRVVLACQAGYDAYEFHRVYHAVNEFCAVQMSAFYLDVIKDRLYCEGKGSVERRAAQTALHTLAVTLAKLLAPVLSHTADEVWGYLKVADKAPSAQLADFPTPKPNEYADVIARWEPVTHVQREVSRHIEYARQQGVVTNPLDARVEVSLHPEFDRDLTVLGDSLSVVLKASQAAIVPYDAGYDMSQPPKPGEVTGESGGVRSTISRAQGQKCARCWLVKEDVGSNQEYPDLCGRCASVVSSLPDQT